MTTSAHDPHTRRLRRGPSALLLLGLLAGALALCLTGGPGSSFRSSHEAPQAGAMPEDELDGKDLRLNDSHRPKVEASFTHESYGPGSRARLVFVSTAENVTLQFFRAGAQHRAIKANDVMLGKSVSSIRRLGAVSPRCTVAARIGNWPSGMYFARLTARGGRVGFAPFVLHPRRLGEHRVAVVLSTQTWQAYNFRDENHDNVGDTWYADWRHKTLRLNRAYLNRGVPSHYKYYEDPFLRWLQATGKDVDYLSDSDLDRVSSGRELARDYVLIIFPGHHEYVTTNEYNVITSFRNLGGNLMFMSADNFYWRVTRHGGYMTKTRSWRNLGRPEASLIGVQYLANDHGTHRGPWRVRDEGAVPWLFEGTHLQ
ncbi:MAG TPA: N,N-dimethylformamidase beta subunit family domain-containing protein, partial [Gaiellaceae bacterium]|nr:N,N-dimethylformamidase beta subunit family domain-containing protein [Gaiellaceae bacterium]